MSKGFKHLRLVKLGSLHFPCRYNATQHHGTESGIFDFCVHGDELIKLFFILIEEFFILLHIFFPTLIQLLLIGVFQLCQLPFQLLILLYQHTNVPFLLDQHFLGLYDFVSSCGIGLLDRCKGLFEGRVLLIEGVQLLRKLAV